MTDAECRDMLENIFNNIKELKNKDSDWMDKMMTLTKRIADAEIKQLILKNVNTSTEILNSLEEVKQNTSSIGKVKKNISEFKNGYYYKYSTRSNIYPKFSNFFNYFPTFLQ